MKNDESNKQLETVDSDISDENAESDEEFYEDPPSKLDRVLDYFGTDKGDVIANRLIAVVEKLAPAANKYLETLSDIKDKSVSIEFKKWFALLIVRFLVVVAALIAAIYLKQTGNLDSTTSLIIVTVATVFFSFGRKSE